MNRQDKICLYLIISVIALQTFNLPLGTLAIVCLFVTEKKAWQKVKTWLSFGPEHWVNTSVSQMQLAVTETKIANLKRNTLEALKLLNVRISSISTQSFQLNERITNLENKYTPNPAQPPVYDIPNNNQAQREDEEVNRTDSPARNTHAHANRTSNETDKGTRNVTFNLRYGSDTAPIVSQTYYFRCELCLQEQFLPFKNLSDVCEKCRPERSFGKLVFTRIVKDGKLWLCSCTECKTGATNKCIGARCAECTGYRSLVKSIRS